MPPALCGGIWGPLTSRRPKSNPVGPWEATTPHTCDPALPRRGAVGAGCCLWCPPPRPQRLDVPQRCQSPPHPHREVNRLPGGGWRGARSEGSRAGTPQPPRLTSRCGRPLAAGMPGTNQEWILQQRGCRRPHGWVSLKAAQDESLGLVRHGAGHLWVCLEHAHLQDGLHRDGHTGEGISGTPPQPPSLWVP